MLPQIRDLKAPLARAYFLLNKSGEDFCSVYGEEGLRGILSRQTIEYVLRSHQGGPKEKIVGNFLEDSYLRVPQYYKVEKVIEIFANHPVDFLVIERPSEDLILTKSHFLKRLHLAMPLTLLQAQAAWDFFQQPIESLL